MPIPEGGGGTDFCPFFKAIENEEVYTLPVCIYLTDGYGEFPQDSNFETLWVITPGGIDSEKVPFGYVCRLI